MIERILVAYLTPLMDGAWVGTRVPNPRPERLVRVDAAGGPRQNIRQDRSMVTVQAWAQYDADLLMAEVRDLLHDMPGRQVTVPTTAGFESVQIYSCTEVGGPTNLPDPETQTPRYQMTVEIRHSH